MNIELEQQGACWNLLGRTNPAGPTEVHQLDSGRTSVGRCSHAGLRINRPTISSSHAELFERDDELWVRDLDSTNGTFVNGARVVGQQRLEPGDLIHFADVPFRVKRVEAAAACGMTTIVSSFGEEAMSLVQFDQLMRCRSVVPHFQPIVTLPDRNLVGYEVLGRSRHYGLQNPRDMFVAASQLNQEAELSELLRFAGARDGELVPGSPCLFLNTHPVELVTSELLESLVRLRRLHPYQDMVLEVHEAAIADAAMMATLRQCLTELDMRLAYDDFGAGETRLIQLANVCPDYVKFDMHMIRDIHLASARHRQLLITLVAMVRDFGSTALAEGVETADEHEVCCEIGFEYGQGYFYGLPLPPEQLADRPQLADLCV